MSSSLRKWIFAPAVAGVLGLAAPAMAEAPAMPLGMRTLPPAGFVDFCRRQPVECQGAPVAPAPSPLPQAAPLQTAATQPSPAPAPASPLQRPRTHWRLTSMTTSSTAAPAPMAAPAATPVAIAPKAVAEAPAPENPELEARLQAKAALMQVMQAKRFNAKSLNPANWSRLTGDPRLDRPALSPPPAPTRIPAVVTPSAPRVAPRPTPDEQAAIPQPAAPRLATPATLDLLTRVNRQQNRRIARAVDSDVFGREDVWSLPTGDRPQGDCEDYVLAKRQALIAAGVSPDALSIAVVRTRRGEGHAVLLARTAQGEYVLDNLSPWVVPWTEAPYTWISRQTGGADRPWVLVGGAAPSANPGARVIHITLAAG